MVAFLRATLGFEQDIMKEGSGIITCLFERNIDKGVTQHLNDSPTPKLPLPQITVERSAILTHSDLLSIHLERNLRSAMLRRNS